MVLPHRNLDPWSKVKWFLLITCWLHVLTPFNRRGTAHAIVRDWVLSLSKEELEKFR